jgi:hypothetical protein
MPARSALEDPASPQPTELAFRTSLCPENTVNKRLLVFATLVALPTVAASQRTRSQADKRTELFDRDSSRQTPTLRVRDVEDQSPIKLLIDKRKDLKLTDAQLSQLKDTESKLKDKNAPLLKAVDSLVRDMRSAASSQSDEARSRARNARMGLMTTLGDVRANYDASAKDAVAALDPDQQSKAAELLEKQKQEVERFFQERLGGGRGERH